MKALLKVLSMALAWLERWQTERKQKIKQRSRDELEKNPHDWFTKRYGGGVRNVPDKQDESGETGTKPDQDR
jgi:hypothetical protein